MPPAIGPSIGSGSFQNRCASSVSPPGRCRHATSSTKGGRCADVFVFENTQRAMERSDAGGGTHPQANAGQTGVGRGGEGGGESECQPQNGPVSHDEYGGEPMTGEEAARYQAGHPLRCEINIAVDVKATPG